MQGGVDLGVWWQVAFTSSALVLLSPQIKPWGMRAKETLFFVMLADIHFLRTGPVV